MESIVLKFSGSLMYPPRKEYMAKLREIVTSLHDNGTRLAIVVGGGPVAREYIDVLRKLGVNQSLQDLVGIMTSRLNAYFTASILYPRSPLRIPKNIEEVLEIYATGLIPVSGGFEPGQSTNAVSLLIAETIGARKVLNLLNKVEGVYDKDPSLPGSKLIEKLTLSELERIVSSYEQQAGRYTLIDHLAVKIARRSRITIHFIDGSNLDNLIRALRGEKIGTIVVPD
ncbi:MAG: UMP kinase [Desulfurococcales archaeon]|nr:UMP kinase [Desulfurococcales archaeon]MCE4626314.1 UMP kinase [Desulfurococcales archaeon]